MDCLDSEKWNIVSGLKSDHECSIARYVHSGWSTVMKCCNQLFQTGPIPEGSTWPTRFISSSDLSDFTVVVLFYANILLLPGWSSSRKSNKRSDSRIPKLALFTASTCTSWLSDGIIAIVLPRVTLKHWKVTRRYTQSHKELLYSWSYVKVGTLPQSNSALHLTR